MLQRTAYSLLSDPICRANAGAHTPVPSRPFCYYTIFSIIHYYSKPKGEPVNEERNNWPVPETLLGQNDRTLSS